MQMVSQSGTLEEAVDSERQLCVAITRAAHVCISEHIPH